MEEKKSLKFFNIFSNVLLYLFFSLSLVLLLFSIISKKNNDDAINIFGYQLRIVTSESMAKNKETYDDIKNYSIKSIPLRSLVLIKTIPDNDSTSFYENLKVGDVLTFKYVLVNKQETITHRIIDISFNEDNGGYIITLQGDNKGSSTNAGVQIIDTSIEANPNYVIGKVVYRSLIIGLLLCILKSKLGIIFIVIIPCIIIMVFEIIKIINYFNESKKKKVAEEVNKQKDEIALLKQQLEEFKKNR